MALQIGDTAPDFEAETTEGRIRFHDWIGDSWAVLFSHPKDFTPVCTTELGYMAKIKPEFDKRNVKVIGLSVDPTDKHEQWAADIEETQGTAPNYPVIGDSEFEVSKLYGDAVGRCLRRCWRPDADGQPDRAERLRRRAGQEGQAHPRLPHDDGPDFDEVLRVIDSLQLTAEHKVATPVNWQQGDDVIIAGSVSDDAAKEIWPEGWESPRPYIRIVPQPAGNGARKGLTASDPERHEFAAPGRPLGAASLGVCRARAAGAGARAVLLLGTVALPTVGLAVVLAAALNERGGGRAADRPPRRARLA